ncbi:MAG: hypothetical protein ACNYWM_06855 [Methanosarcinales archaeon]
MNISSNNSFHRITCIFLSLTLCVALSSVADAIPYKIILVDEYTFTLPIKVQAEPDAEQTESPSE